MSLCMLHVYKLYMAQPRVFLLISINEYCIYDKCPCTYACNIYVREDVKQYPPFIFFKSTFPLKYMFSRE